MVRYRTEHRLGSVGPRPGSPTRARPTAHTRAPRRSSASAPGPGTARCGLAVRSKGEASSTPPRRRPHAGCRGRRPQSPITAWSSLASTSSTGGAHPSEPSGATRDPHPRRCTRDTRKRSSARRVIVTSATIPPRAGSGTVRTRWTRSDRSIGCGRLARAARARPDPTPRPSRRRRGRSNRLAPERGVLGRRARTMADASSRTRVDRRPLVARSTGSKNSARSQPFFAPNTHPRSCSLGCRAEIRLGRPHSS